MTEEKNTNPSRLEVLHKHKPKTKVIDVVRPLFEFDQRSRQAGVKVKALWGDRHEDAKPLEYLLDNSRRDILERKTPEEIIELGNALLSTKTPLQTFLDNDFYRKQFMHGNSRDLIALIKELGHEAYASWDRENLIKKEIPRSRVVIEEVGLDQFLRNMKYCTGQGIDLPLALEWGIPVMEDVIIKDLRNINGGKQTAKKHYKEVVDSLESVEGVVSEEERRSLVRQLKAKIDQESEKEVGKINNYLKEFDKINKAIVQAGLEPQKVYDYLRKEKFESLDQFLDRSKEILEELIELPRIIAARDYKPFDTFSLEERAKHTEQGVRRYQEIAKLIRGEDCFDKLAAEASQEFFAGSPFNIWDNITGYGKIIGAILGLVPLSEEEYRKIIEASERYGYKKDRAGGRGLFFTVETDDPTTLGIATELRKRQIGKGLRIAEIGGTVSTKVMEALGANTSYANGGYRELFAVAFAKCKMDIIEDPEQLVRLDHYKHKFDGKYDFTVTNKVFDGGSGVDAIAEEKGYPRSEDDRSGTMELLAILSNLTKDGGYSIHGGFTIGVPKKYMDYLGFDEVNDSGFGQDSLTVLTKREPKPELYPEGIEVGFKRFDFNRATEEFCLR